MSVMSITQAATASNLTTLAAVKSALNIEDNDEDEYLALAIAQASALIVTELNVRPGGDGRATLGREDVSETWRLPRPARRLVLSRRPVSAIAAVSEDGAALAATDYELDPASGLLARLSGGAESEWPAATVVVTYTAGWRLPEETDRNLPADIEAVAIDIVKMARAARLRDPKLKSLDVVGVIRRDYWVGAIGDGALPPDLAARLAPWRNWSVT